MVHPLLPLVGLLALGCLCAQGAELELRLRDQGGKAVPEAVLLLRPSSPGLKMPALRPVSLEVVQQNGEFSPYVSVVPLGSKVLFPNKDEVQHHVYSLSPAKRFEIPLHGGEARHEESFDAPGLVTIGCNIHDWMLAYILVSDTPWFGLSDEEGLLHLRDLPEGTYRLQLWHPRLSKTLEEDLILNTGATTRSLSLKLKPDRRIRRSLEGKPAGYR